MADATERLGAADVERIAARNRAEWLDLLNRADSTADRLDMLAALLVHADSVYNEAVMGGMVSIITEGADTLRELGSLVSSYHPSPYRPDKQTEAEAGDGK